MMNSQIEEPDQEMTEEQLEARDIEVARDLTAAVTYKRELAAQMRRDAAELERQARYIEQEVRAERWYNLEGTLEDSLIESLCNVSPVDLLGRLQDGVS